MYHTSIIYHNKLFFRAHSQERPKAASIRFIEVFREDTKPFSDVASSVDPSAVTTGLTHCSGSAGVTVLACAGGMENCVVGAATALASYLVAGGALPLSGMI